MVGKLSIDVPMKKEEAARMRNTTAWMNRGNYEDIHVPSRVLTVTNRSAIIDYHVSINYLILRCQPVVLSLSLRDSHLDAYFQVSNHRLSLSQNCHLDAYFQVSNHRLSLSLTELSPRCLFPGVKPTSLSHTNTHHCHPDAYFQLSNHCLSFPEVVTSMLISRCRTIVSLSLTEIVTSISFLHTETNVAQARRMHSASQ
jgi:hypothetical protein